MAGVRLLSETKCKSAKPKQKMYYLNDGGGLRLRCRTDGGKTWMFRYYYNKTEQSIGIGTYPKITLQIARSRVEEFRSQLSEGKNPTIEKMIQKKRIPEREGQTFGKLARDWMAHNKDFWSEKHFTRNEGLIRLYLLPDLGRLPVNEIDEVYLFASLKPAYDRGRQESARRARSIAAQIFEFGKHTHQCLHNPAKEMSGNSYFRKPKVKHLTAIEQDDVPMLLRQLRKTGDDQKLEPTTVYGILLALYTGLRSHSIRGAKWKEINFNKGTWTVPGERMKSRQAHTVPLPSQAVAALSDLWPQTYINEDSFIFSSKAKAGYISENTLRLGLRRIGINATIHGFRSLISDVLNENGFKSAAVDRQLDNCQQNSVRAAYLRSNFDKQRREMMQWFGDWCEREPDCGSFGDRITLSVGRD